MIETWVTHTPVHDTVQEIVDMMFSDEPTTRFPAPKYPETDEDQ